MVLEIQTPFHEPTSSDRVLISLKKQAVSISINSRVVYTFDLLGRLITAFSNGHTFRRGLDNRVMEKWSITKNGQKLRVRFWLNRKQRRAFFNKIHYDIWKLFCIVQQGQFEPVSCADNDPEGTKNTILTFLNRILDFDYTRLEKDARDFAAIYRPVGVLPPDRYLSLLLQATEGCSYNRCNYCTFYRGQAFRIKSLPEFRQHVEAVKTFFGASLALRKGLFLGEANALNIPHSILLSFFEIIYQTLPDLGGIFGFMSPFGRPQKTADDFAELKAANLRRVYVGMETGSDRLLRLLNKPARVENTLDLVRAIKKGGVNVGVIILLGAGGDKFYDVHVSQTARALKEMDLGEGDIVYFSPIIGFPGTLYEKRLAEELSHPLPQQDLARQKKDILRAMRFPKSKPHKAPKIASYDINEFIY